MNIVTYSDISHAVANTLKIAKGVKKVEAHDELSESITVTPLLQIYPQKGNTDAVGENDRAVFNAAIRRNTSTIIVDGYARQRSHRALDIKAQVDLIDAIDTVLVQQKKSPLFGLNDIQTFSWEWERVYFGDENTPIYAGCKFTITIWIY